jgi:hypothetical protein
MPMTLFEKLPDLLREQQTRFVEIADAFGHRHRLPASQGPEAGTPFEFGGVPMSLRYDPLSMPFHVVVVVDFGPAPVDNAEALRELLEASFAGAPAGGVYGIAPGTGHVVCFAPIGLEGLDVDRLESALAALAAAARGAVA